MKFYIYNELTQEETEIPEGTVITAKEGDQRLFMIDEGGEGGLEVDCWTGGMAIHPVVSNVIRIEAKRIK